MKRTTATLLVLLMLTAACAVSAAQPAPPTQFSDVDPDTSAGRAIYEMISRGVISGDADGLFLPNAPITAAQYITMLAKLRGLTPSAASSPSPDAGYMQAALDAHWYDWDQIPPNEPGSSGEPVERELAANILVAAFFGTVSYDWSVHEQISDFSEVGGRYYAGVLGGLALRLFDQVPGTPFYPLRDLSRADACVWAANALVRAENTPVSSASAAPPSPAVSADDAPAGTESSASAPYPDSALLSGGVSKNGWLQVKGTQLCSESGDPVVLHGMSSMGIQWYPQYTNVQCISNTVERGANVFRIAMYTEEGGYLSDKQKFTDLVDEIVRNAIECDVYVIIDWHILSDGNPMSHLSDAIVFFDRMSKKYAATPNVLYEICNEPNGNITWDADVKPYAEQIVSVIRSNSSRGIILIGNPMWDQDVVAAAADPVQGANLMYTLHFYAGTHHQELRAKATQALEMGAPLFVSEWGTSAADGSGGFFRESSDEWMEYMKDHCLSWCNWSLCDKNETSAALVPGAPYNMNWTERDLSESGRYVFSRFTYGLQQSPAMPHVVPVTAQEAAAQYGALHPGDDIRISREDDLLSGAEIVSTGCRAAAVSPDGIFYAQSVIVIPGDVLGTGEITISQLVRMAQALGGRRPLKGIYAIAGDVDNSSDFGITDLVIEARFLTHGGRLACQFINENQNSI